MAGFWPTPLSWVKAFPELMTEAVTTADNRTVNARRTPKNLFMWLSPKAGAPDGVGALLDARRAR